MKIISAKWLLMSALVAAFCFFSNLVNAQTELPDTLYADQLFAKAKALLYKDRDSSIYYLKQVEDVSKKINYQRGIANALYGYGITEEVLYKRFQYFTRSLQIFEANHDAFGVGLNLVRIGNIYEQIGQKEKALQYYKQALEIKMKINDFGGVALSLINIGKLYRDQGDLDEALKYFEHSLVYRLKEGTHQGIGFSQVNISDVLLRKNKIEQALIMADSAVSNFSFTPDLEGQIWSLGLKGKCLVKLGKLNEASEIFETINLYPKRVHYTNLYLDAKRELINIYKQHGDVKAAFDTQTEYLIAKDSLANRDYRAETQRLVNQYEFNLSEQKAKRESELNEQRIARRNSLEYLSIAIIVLLLFAFLFSGRRRLSSKIVNAFLLIGLLLLFEFLLILTDSPLDKLTQGEPILKLLVNVILALLILPGHQFLEHYTRKRLIQSHEN